MKIQSIQIMCKPNKPCFSRSERRQNIDRAATVADLYEMEDRINAKNAAIIKKQNEILGNMEARINNFNEISIVNQNRIIGRTLEDAIRLIYFRPVASAQDCYKKAEKSAQILANGGMD